MMRLVRLPLAAAALFLVVSCHGDRATTPNIGSPSAAISDGAHEAGNPDFFFLPPMVPNPSTNPNFETADFNSSLAPVVQICEGITTAGTECVGAEIAEFTMTTGPGSERVRGGDQHYIVNWHTNEFDLATGVYRIRVIVGTTVLGHADVELGANRAELKNVNTQQFVPLVDGRTLPIRFRIEVGAACFEVDPCTQKVINLSEDNTIILETGDRVDIPAQNTNRVITVTLQLCDGINVDSPVFGNCLSVTADPPLGGLRLDPLATVSMCSIRIDEVALPPPPQDELVTMYRRDNGAVFALPHTDDFCGDPIFGSVPTSLFGQFARAVGRLFAPRTLHATTAVLNVGDAGDTDFFSDFQLVLPAQMEALEGTDGQTGEPGSLVANPPGVRVTDRNGAPVRDATIRFEVTAGDGTIVAGRNCEAGTPITCLSVITGEDGEARATLASWTLGTAGTNTVRAFGFGVAGPGDGGPFMPDNIDGETGEPIPPEDQEMVTVETGEVIFTATGTASATIFQATFTNDEPNLPPGPAEIGTLNAAPVTDGTALVRSNVGGIEGRSLEVSTPGAIPGAPLITATVAGTPPSSGVYVVRWRSAATGGSPTMNFVVRSSTGLILAGVGYSTGAETNPLIFNSGGPNQTTVGEWNLNGPQLFELTIDLTAKNVSLSINGAAIASVQNAEYFQSGAATLASLTMDFGGLQAYSMVWDDIEIFPEPLP